MPKNSSKQRADLTKKALDLLRHGHDLEEVATLLGVSRRTLERWRFKAEKNNQASLSLVPQINAPSSFIASSQMPSEPLGEGEVRSKIDCLTGLALSNLENILLDPDARTSDRLRASQLILTVAGWTDAAATVPSRAIELLLRQGYIITDPTLPPEDSGARGLTDAMAELIKEKILFGRL